MSQACHSLDLSKEPAYPGDLLRWGEPCFEASLPSASVTIFHLHRIQPYLIRVINHPHVIPRACLRWSGVGIKLHPLNSPLRMVLHSGTGTTKVFPYMAFALCTCLGPGWEGPGIMTALHRRVLIIWPRRQDPALLPIALNSPGGSSWWMKGSERPGHRQHDSRM